MSESFELGSLPRDRMIEIEAHLGALVSFWADQLHVPRPITSEVANLATEETGYIYQPYIESCLGYLNERIETEQLTARELACLIADLAVQRHGALNRLASDYWDEQKPQVRVLIGRQDIENVSGRFNRYYQETRGVLSEQERLVAASRQLMSDQLRMESGVASLVTGRTFGAVPPPAAPYEFA